MTSSETGRFSADGPGSVLSRSLEVLEALAAMAQPANLMDIAYATGLSKHSAYRILRNLQEQGFVDHIGRRGYRVGTRAMALASLISPRPHVLQRVRPVIHKLAHRVQESVSFHVHSNRHRVCLLGIEPFPNPERRHLRTGERAPLVSGCAGLAILAFLPDGEIAEILDSQSETSQAALRASLQRIREDGFAISHGSNHAGMHGIGSPIVSVETGTALASVSISGTAARLPDQRLRQFAAPLQSATRELGTVLTDVLGSTATMAVDRLDVGPGELYVDDAWLG